MCAPALKFTLNNKSRIILFNRFDAIFVASATLDEAAWYVENILSV
jgi:hypothetical protein